MRYRLFLLSLCVGFSFSLAKADQIPAGDPIIKTGGRGTGAVAHLGKGTPAPTPIIVSSFTIASPTGTSPGTSPCVLTQGSIKLSSPGCLFENFITVDGAGQDISSLIFDAPTIPFDKTKDQCGFLTGSPFASCGVDPLTGGGTEFSFSNGSIPFQTDFTLDFEGFPANTSFASTASVSPEPASFVLFLLGGFAVALMCVRARITA